MKIIRTPLAMLALASFTVVFASDTGSLPARQAESRATRPAMHQVESQATRLVESQAAACWEACRAAKCAMDQTKPAQVVPAEKIPESK